MRGSILVQTVFMTIITSLILLIKLAVVKYLNYVKYAVSFYTVEGSLI